MRCNYNLDTQQSEITSTTTYVPGGGGFLVASVILYIGRQPRAAEMEQRGWGWVGIYLSYTKYFFFLSFPTSLLSGSFFLVLLSA